MVESSLKTFPIYLIVASTIGCINVERIDIAFLIDSSRSVTEEDFQRQKEFIREIVGEFPVGPEKSLVGVIKYGTGANVEIRFSDYTDEKMLLERVDRLQHSAATESRLDAALQLAQDSLFTREAGARIGDQKTRQVGIAFYSPPRVLSDYFS